MKKACRRRHYALVDPIRTAMEGAGITQDGPLDKLRLLELSAIESFAKGQATPSDWRAVSDFLNIAEVMARGGVGPEALSACLAVDAALEDAHRRYVATGRLGMTGPQLLALRELHEWHDLQRKSIARSEYERWIQRTANLIRSAHPSVRKVFA
jgi:hypothetical protein